MVSISSGRRVWYRTLIKRLLSETSVLEPLKKTKHWECEKYQPLLLIAILMITKSMGCTFPMSILTSEIDSSPQTVLKMDVNTAWKRLDISLDYQINGVYLPYEYPHLRNWFFPADCPKDGRKHCLETSGHISQSSRRHTSEEGSIKLVVFVCSEKQTNHERVTFLE